MLKISSLRIPVYSRCFSEEACFISKRNRSKNSATFYSASVNEDVEKIKPVAPFSKNPQVAVEKPFIDYNTGEVLQGREYWKPLSDVFLDYIDHPEAKFEGDVGVLQRRHLKPKGCVYIGKEANNIDI
ncbi:hypothetical protein [Methanococcoides sp. FTZ1]|uniref:hypothetical protein n=1 Tax=Methanococcoides sp. FTZ1 TaxID=3439061 RepID=UPI003F84D211